MSAAPLVNRPLGKLRTRALSSGAALVRSVMPLRMTMLPTTYWGSGATIHESTKCRAPPRGRTPGERPTRLRPMGSGLIGGQREKPSCPHARSRAVRRGQGGSTAMGEGRVLLQLRDDGQGAVASPASQCSLNSTISLISASGQPPSPPLRCQCPSRRGGTRADTSGLSPPGSGLSIDRSDANDLSKSLAACVRVMVVRQGPTTVCQVCWPPAARLPCREIAGPSAPWLCATERRGERG